MARKSTNRMIDSLIFLVSAFCLAVTAVKAVAIHRSLVRIEAILRFVHNVEVDEKRQ